MDSYDNNFDYEPPQRVSVVDKLRNALKKPDAGDALMPSGQDYYSSNEDYDSGVIRSKNSVKAAKIAGRVVMTGAVLAGMGAAWFNRSQIVEVFQHTAQPTEVTAVDNNTFTSTTEKPTLTPEPTKAAVEVHSDSYFGIKINYDNNGIPLSYNNGSGETPIDGENLQTLVVKAKEEGLPQLVFSTSLVENKNSNTQSFEYSQDRPEVTELPTDTLTDEQLEERGITIIQGKDVKLHLRESAFLPGESLDSYKVGGTEKLKIVLVDGPTVSAAYMKDAKYDEVRDSVGSADVDVEKYRQSEIDFWQEQTDELTKTIKEGKQSANIDSLQEELLVARVRLEETKAASTESLAVFAGMSEMAGLYDPSTRTTFIAVGKSENTDVGKKEILMYIDKDGNLKMTNSESFTALVDYVPKPSQSYPRPSDFSYISEKGEMAPTTFPERPDPDKVDSKDRGYDGFTSELPMSYPYGGQEPSQILRHEIKHNEKMSEHPTSSYTLNRSEWYTDMETMGDINDAYTKWKDSGYTDDIGYWAVFEFNGEIIMGNNVGTTAPAM